MLQAGHNENNAAQRAPPSPIRRLTQPALPLRDPRASPVRDAEFVSSTPVPKEGARIRREAFSPHYFKTFFVEERELGRGGKGVVLLVRHEIDGCALGQFACKRVPVGDDHAWLEKVLIEVELLAKLTHPNLVSYRHVWLEDVKLHRFGPSVACAFILQQYCNSGDLLQYIVGDAPKEATKEQLKAKMRRRSKGQTERLGEPEQWQRHLPFEDIYSLFRDIVSGLAYLHDANYIHRDLKPSNCLLHRENGKLTCLISDFGEVQPENAVRKSTGTTGTISYCAPEVLIQDANGRFGNFTTKSDIFSLGMILYFLCFGRLPYTNANSIQEELEDVDLLRAEIAGWKGFQDERRERPDLPPKLYQLLKRLLALNPADRPSATEVLGAITHESHMGGPRREPRSTSPSGPLHGRRIHNLESPKSAASPVPDPAKPRYQDPDPSDGLEGPVALVPKGRDQSPSATQSNSVQKHASPNLDRRLSLGLELSPKQNGHQHPRSDRKSPAEEGEPLPSPPLLMPPPTTFLGAVQHRSMMMLHHLDNVYHNNAASIVFLLRLAIFFFKMASLANICWPYMVKVGIGAPVIGIATLDLGMPRPYNLDMGSGPADARRWNWGWTFTFLLLLLHFVVLGVIHRWGSVCVASQEHWVDW